MREIDYRKRYAVEYQYRSTPPGVWYLEKSYHFLWLARRKARYTMSFLSDICTYRVVDTKDGT